MDSGIKRGGLALMISLILVLSATLALGATIKHFTLREPTVMYVEKGDILKFDHDGTEYEISITNMYTYSVEFQISGKLTYFILHENEEVMVNLDDFGENDLKVKARSIVPRRKATIEITKMLSPTPVVEAPPPKPVNRTWPPQVEEKNETNETSVLEEDTPEEDAAEQEEDATEETSSVEETPARDYGTAVYALIVILAFAAGIGIFLYAKVSSYAVAGVPPKLTKYVNNAMELQQSIDQIQEDLKAAGWNDQEVELAIKYVQGRSQSPVAK